MRVDALRDLKVLEAGDVEMYSGDAERSVRDLQEAVHAVTRNGAIPLVLGGDHTIAWPTRPVSPSTSARDVSR
jgi:arginase family enzyme